MNAIDVDAALRNVVLLLQADPRNYRKFGVWWWPIKALLRRRYNTDQLYLLGSYTDPDGCARVPQMPLAETLQAAFEEYAQNDRYGLDGDTVTDPEGQAYRIYDADAGL